MKDKLKAKLKSYSFWVSLASAVMVFLNTLGLKVDIPYLSQVTTAFLSILVIAGILTKPGSEEGQECKEGELSEEAPSEEFPQSPEEEEVAAPSPEGSAEQNLPDTKTAPPQKEE